MIPQPNEIYRHFKGNLYRIITLAEHSETEEPLVVYQALYGEYKVFARPLAMFMEPVDRKKYPRVQQKMRFELVKEMAGITTPAEWANACRKKAEPECSYVENTENVIEAVHQEDKENITESVYEEVSERTVTKEQSLTLTKRTVAKEQPLTLTKRTVAKEQPLTLSGKSLEEEQSLTEGTQPEEPAAMRTATAESLADKEPVKTRKESFVTEKASDGDIPRIDPMLEAFLDADNYRERLNILRGLEHRITDIMINTMAVVMDITIPEGKIQDRYDALQNCLVTLERYECNRLTR